jgi:CRP-like cAMP-binding protein
MEMNHPQLYSDLECLYGADRYFDEILKIIDHVKMFEDLSDQEVQTLSSFMTCYAAPRGYTLLSEGQEGSFLMLILTGSVEVMKAGYGNNPGSIAQIGPGGTVGEMSLVDGQPRYASCITLEPTDFAVLTRIALNQILLQMPRLGNKLLLILLQMMTSRLRDTCDRILPNTAIAPPA